MTVALTAVSGQLGHESLQALLRLDTGRPVVGLAPPRGGSGRRGPPRGLFRPQCTQTVALGSRRAAPGLWHRPPPEDRIQQHRNVIDAAKAAGVRRIVDIRIQGADEGTAFSPVVQSNLQNEVDIRASGLDWAVRRNGIYIEPDIEYLPNYVAAGEIANCAGDGRCGYKTRPEMPHAHACLLTFCPSSGFLAPVAA